MKKNSNQKQAAAKWLERRKTLKEQIEKIKQQLQTEFPGEALLRRAADDARDRLNNFFSVNKDKNGKIPENKQRQLEALQVEYNNENEKAKAAIEQRRELDKKLNALQKELADLKYVFTVGSFSVAGLGEMIRESVKPIIDMIKAQRDKINSLKQKRDELEAEIENFECDAKSLGDDELLSSTVEGHATGYESIKQLQAKKEAAEDLLQQTKDAIRKNETQLEPIRNELVEALKSVVEDYARIGTEKTAKKLKSILDEDEKFSKAVFEISRDLAAETGASMTPIEAHIFMDKEAIDGVLKMVDKILR